MYQDGKCIFTIQCKTPAFSQQITNSVTITRNLLKRQLDKYFLTQHSSFLKQTQNVPRRGIYATRIMSLVNGSKNSKQRKEEVDDIQIQGDRSPYVLIVGVSLLMRLSVSYKMQPQNIIDARTPQIIVEILPSGSRSCKERNNTL